MGWNGSTEGRATSMTSPQKKIGAVASSRRPYQRGLLAGLLVVALGGAAVWWFCGGRGATCPTDDGRDRARPSRIATVSPHIVTNHPAPAPKGPSNAERLRAQFPGTEVPDNWDKPYHPKAYWPDGTLKKYSRYVRVITNKASRASMSIEDLTFENRAERNIASALLIEPGESLLGEYRYNENFKDEFIASLNTPIVIDKEKDTPAQQELKQAVIEAKKELKAALDRGEDIVALMNETRKQYEELSLYRDQIQQMVKEARAEHGDELTEKDEEDLIKAANMMLEERGCKKLTMPNTFIEQAENL